MALATSSTSWKMQRKEQRRALIVKTRKAAPSSEVLKQRLGDCVKEFNNRIFDTCSNEKLVGAARKLILKSGKKHEVRRRAT
jgi:hypothetical protein